MIIPIEYEIEFFYTQYYIFQLAIICLGCGWAHKLCKSDEYCDYTNFQYACTSKITLIIILNIAIFYSYFEQQRGAPHEDMTSRTLVTDPYFTDGPMYRVLVVPTIGVGKLN